MTNNLAILLERIVNSEMLIVEQRFKAAIQQMTSPVGSQTATTTAKLLSSIFLEHFAAPTIGMTQSEELTFPRIPELRFRVGT